MKTSDANWTKKMLVALAAMTLAGLPAFAQDAGVEMGAEDDLTVLGTEGNQNDADLEVKGFSTFGETTGMTIPAEFTNGPGSAIVASNLYIGGKLKAGQIDLSGANMTVSNLTVEGALEVQGNSLNVLQPATLQSNLSVGGAVTVTQDANITGGLDVGGNADVAGGLGVGGNAAVTGNLDVDGATSLDDTTIDGQLTVNGSTTITNALNVGGASTLNTVSVTDDASVGGDLSVTGGASLQNTTVGGTLGVTGNASLQNTAVGGTLGVTGNATLSNTAVGGTLGVSGAASFSSSADVTGALTAGSLSVQGNSTLGDAASDAVTVNGTIQNASPLVFEGGSADANQTTFQITDPTADRVITFPDASGTIALLSDVANNYATRSLGNLTNVAINTSLLPASDNAIDLGSAGASYRDAYVDGTADVGTLAADSAGVAGNANLAVSSGAVGVGTASPDSSTKLQVNGGGTAGDYATKIYVGSDLAAWVRKK